MLKSRFLLAAGLTLLLLGTTGQARAADVTTGSAPAAAAQPVITYALQLGSFHERQSAVGEEPHFLQSYGDLISKASMIIEEAPSGPHGTVLRLVAGSFATRAAAEAACARLIAGKDSCIVLKRVDGHAPDAATEGSAAKESSAAAPARTASAHVTIKTSAPAKSVATAAAATTVPMARVIPVSFTAPPALAVESAVPAPVKPVTVAEAPAAETTSPPPPPARRAAARPNASAARLEQPNRTIGLELGKGTLIHVDQPASTVFIADPSIADVAVKSPRMIYLYGKKVGDTVLYVVGANEHVMLKAQVTVRHDLVDLRQALHGLVPEGSVEVATAGNALVLSGSVPTAAMSADVQALASHFVPGKDDIINRLKVTEPDQINLQVRVAEMSRSTLKNFGINLDALTHVGNFIFGAASGLITSGTGTGGFNTRSTVSGASATNNNLFGGFSTSKSSVNGLIDALSTEGLITVLAEPNLTALSGETASFLAGGEFPIPVPQGNNTTTIMFKQFGVSLSFTPTILSDHRIDLRVRPEVSELSSVGAVQINGFTIPALTERRADTTVELASGQSFAIAGLLQNNSENDISKFPGLGDLPVLGALFRSTEFQRNETELVIIVTPYIVRPVSAKRMASPLDGLVPPNDIERIFAGKSYRSELARGGAAPLGQNGLGLIGPVGFMLE